METTRLFFAVWPDDATRDKVVPLIDQFHKAHGGRPIAKASLHVTLAFLGETPTSRLPELNAIGRSITTSAFDLTLNRAGCWSGGIFWLAPMEPAPALMTLAATLGDKLKAAGVPFDVKRFVPHMTVLRRAGFRGEQMTIAPIEFSVREFVLVRSIKRADGVTYEVIERFALGSL